MAPSAAFTTTRPGRVLHWLFPSRRAAAAAALAEAAAMVLELPLPAHVVVALAIHAVVLLTE